MVVDISEDLDVLGKVLAVQALPARAGAYVHAAVVERGCSVGVVREDDAERAGALAEGTLVVGGGVLDPVIAMGVHLDEAGHAAFAQVGAGSAHRCCADGVVARCEVGVGENDRGYDGEPVICGIAGEVDEVTVEVGDAFDAARVPPELAEQSPPRLVGDQNLRESGDAHAAASSCGPR